jgi:hypothetical protein
MLDENRRLYLKKLLTNNYKIDGVLRYINQINDEKIIKDGNLTLRVYYRKDKDKIDEIFLMRVMKRAKIIIGEKIIIINLILTLEKKKFNNCNTEILTEKNVNSGFTYVNGNEIFIFRREEFPKVILHEMIHHNLNIHNDEFKEINKKKLMKAFEINERTTLILNEAMVELWATILHLSFIAKENNWDLKKLMYMELRYSLYKCWQIMRLRDNKLWFDKCNIYSYIIFKTILLNYLDDLNKIYKYPNKYDDTIITDFIIKHKKLPKIERNPKFKLDGKIIQRDDKSLCFMLLSDL